MTNPSLPYPLPQKQPNITIVGVTVGKYLLYKNGIAITTLYSGSFLQAMKDAPQVLEESRTPAATIIDWETCVTCGKTFDVGGTCPCCNDDSILINRSNGFVEVLS